MYRALMVDDEPLMLEGLRLMIRWESCGFTLVGEASSAQEALRQIEALQPDLLVTDVRMPGMLGTDLAELCRRYYPRLKVLFFSGYRDFGYAQAAIHAGAVGYLTKPIDPDEVHAALSEVKAELDAQAATQGEEPALRNHTLRRIASGDHSEETLLRAAALLPLVPGQKCCCVLLEPEKRAALSPDDEDLRRLHATPFRLAAGQAGLCVRADVLDEALLEQLSQQWAAKADTRLLIGVGKVGVGIEGFAQSLQEAQDALEVLFEKHGSLRVYRPYDAEIVRWLMAADLPTLLGCLDSGDEAALEAALKELCGAVKRKQPSMTALRFMARQAEPALLGLMIRNGMGDTESGLLRELWHEEELPREAWLDAFCERMRQLGQQTRTVERRGEQPDAVRQVLQIVENEYYTPLSITDIAGRLYLNPAYLGQLVRRATGVTFNRHLLNVRLEHACRLLRQTRLTIREVAATVGIRDVNYFSTQFRHEFAMSPNAYRGLVVPEGGVNE